MESLRSKVLKRFPAKPNRQPWLAWLTELSRAEGFSDSPIKSRVTDRRYATITELGDDVRYKDSCSRQFDDAQCPNTGAMPANVSSRIENCSI